MSYSKVTECKCVEITLGLSNGLRIAVKQWGNEHAKTRILAVHGWLDSAATYDRIAPMIVSHLDARLVCMDFSGHGNSSHKSHDASYVIADRPTEIADVADALKWDKFVLMAHSMGGAIATLYTAAQPNRVEKLILVDALGTWPGEFGNVTRMKKALDERVRWANRQRRIYTTLDEPIDRYLKSNPHMSKESARILLTRAMKEVEVFESRVSNNVDHVAESGEKRHERQVGYVFKHDHRCMAVNTTAFSDTDALEFCRAIKCPVLLFMAINPARIEDYKNKKPYMRWLVKTYSARVQIMDNIIVKWITGSHHLHLDQPEKLFPMIQQFLINDSAFARSKSLGFPTQLPSKM